MSRLFAQRSVVAVTCVFVSVFTCVVVVVVVSAVVAATVAVVVAVVVLVVVASQHVLSHLPGTKAHKSCAKIVRH